MSRVVVMVIAAWSAMATSSVGIGLAPGVLPAAEDRHGPERPALADQRRGHDRVAARTAHEVVAGRSPCGNERSVR